MNRKGRIYRATSAVNGLKKATSRLFVSITAGLDDAPRRNPAVPPQPAETAATDADLERRFLTTKPPINSRNILFVQDGMDDAPGRNPAVPLPSQRERLHQVLAPSLRLVSAILSALPKSEDVKAEVRYLFILVVRSLFKWLLNFNS